ncbi:MAG: Hsp33 family molecular chaperone HslO [bacterium]|nr:Hsp33 family molecular chaperone HslO [bacterium]
MTDALLRAIGAEGAILGCAVIVTGVVEEARRRHGTLPTATAALGRALSAVAMLSSGLKPRQSVMLRILGDGPLGPVVADGTADGAVRGYVTNPIVHLPPTASNKLDVGAAVGRSGTIHVTRDLGLRDTYRGSVPLVSGEVGEDLAAYLVASEQVPSAVAVGVMVAPSGEVPAAGGWMLQVLPGAPATIPAFLEERVRALQPVTQMISSGATPRSREGGAGPDRARPLGERSAAARAGNGGSALSVLRGALRAWRGSDRGGVCLARAARGRGRGGYLTRLARRDLRQAVHT